MIPTLIVLPTNDLDSARQYLLNNFPDYSPLFVFPDEDELVVAQVKTLKQELKFAYTQDIYVAIGGIDRSSSEVQNMLLKFLEEHGAHLHIFLFVTRLAGVLPTIQSRCLLVNTVLSAHGPTNTATQHSFTESLPRLMVQSLDTSKEAVQAYLYELINQATQLSELSFLLTQLSLLQNNNVSPVLIHDNVLIFMHKKSRMR